jgi:hypothetical protein
MDYCDEFEDSDGSPWVWGAVAAGVVLGAVGVVWLLQYRKPDRSMDRLLRRCYDRLEDIEASVTSLLPTEGSDSR